MRQCTKCKQAKDDEEFSWNKQEKGKRQSRCKTCMNEDHHDYYEKTKPARLEYKAKYQVDKREEARRFVFGYLQTHPCVDCGERDPMVLTFDHVNGNKKMNISQMVNKGYAVATIQNELVKCVVRCGNCHLRLEKIRRGTKYPI